MGERERREARFGERVRREARFGERERREARFGERRVDGRLMALHEAVGKKFPARQSEEEGGAHSRAMECAICLAEEAVDRVALRPCGHSFCKACVETLVSHDVKCPMCRQTLLGTTPPLVTFDPRRLRRFVLPFCKSKTLGIVFVGNPIERRVRVKHVTPGSIAWFSGIEVGMEIVSVNGVPCYDPVVTQRVLVTSRDWPGSVTMLDVATRRRITIASRLGSMLSRASRFMKDEEGVGVLRQTL